MKRKILPIVFILIIICSLLVSCDGDVVSREYSVISIISYDITTGYDNGPIVEKRIAFVYMNDGDPQFIKNFCENDERRTHVVIGDENKYVVHQEYRKVHYLYLTQDTYDSVFGKSDSEIESVDLTLMQS